MPLDRDSLIARFESMGEDAVRAELVSGSLSTIDRVRARHWLKAKEKEKEEGREKADRAKQRTNWFQWAVIVLIGVVTIALMIWLR